MRRNLDLPDPVIQVVADTGDLPSTRQKRKLSDFRLPNFHQWPLNRAIPYMFDGQHSKLCVFCGVVETFFMNVN